MQRILICDPDTKQSEKIAEYLIEQGIEVCIAINGKDAQLQLYKGQFHTLILDFHTHSHSSLEVMKYCALNYSSINIIFTVPDMKEIKDLDIDENKLKRLGACDVILKPYALSLLLRSIDGQKQFEKWATAEGNSNIVEEEVKAFDDEFTRISIDEFFLGKIAIFDIYIRLKENHYVRILKQKDFFDRKRITKWKNEKKVEFLYFKTKDRKKYVNFMNGLISNVVKCNKISSAQKTSLVKNVATKLIEDIYSVGITPQLIEESESVCENLTQTIKREPELYKLLNEFKEYSEDLYTHSFLVMFYANIIVQKTDWASKKTREIVLFGSLFHDIALTKLPKEVQTLSKDDLPPEYLTRFTDHPKEGARMLNFSKLISSSVIDVVTQHHENQDGTGYPDGLSGTKIYPLAKIIRIADEFVSQMVHYKLTPKETLKKILQDHDLRNKLDGKILSNFITAFIQEDKNGK